MSTGHEIQTGVTADAEALVSKIIRCWPSGRPFDAEAVLAENPELNGNRSAVLDLAYEEYCRRISGEVDIPTSDFARRFPSVQRSLLRLLEVHRFLESNPHLIDGAAAGKTAWPATGETIWGFRLVHELGRGAVSRVFLAREAALGNRLIVLKLCLGGIGEAHTLGQLQHSHIVPVFSVNHDEETGLTGICMPYHGCATLYDVIDVLFANNSVPKYGRQLSKAVADVNAEKGPEPGTLPGNSQLHRGSFVNAVVEIGVQLAEALHFTHSRNILHCDIKPSNVLLTLDAGAMLFDFSLAFKADSTSQNVGGTIPYMPPEQLRAFFCDPDAEPTYADARADVYSLGATLYELLSGRLPFGPIPSHLPKRQLAQALLDKQRQGPQRIDRINRDIDAGLGQLIQSCLAFDPQDRPASAAVLSRSLRNELSRKNRWLRSARRHWMVSLAAATVVIVALSAATYSWPTMPSKEVRLLRAAKTALQDQRYGESRRLLTKLLLDNPEHEQARFLRGLACMRAGDFSDALDDFHSVHSEELHAYVSGCIGHCYACIACSRGSDEHFITAIEFYKRALRYGIASAALQNNIGFCYRLQGAGSFDQAVKWLRKAINSDAHLPHPHVQLARIQRIRSDMKSADGGKSLEEAHDQIERALRVAQDFPEAHTEAAIIRAYLAKRFSDSKHSPEKAQSYFRKAVGNTKAAVERGVPAAKLAMVRKLLEPLDTNNEIESLLSSASGPGRTKRTVLLVDPLAALSLPF